jgi:hypothetical protein
LEGAVNSLIDVLTQNLPGRIEKKAAEGRAIAQAVSHWRGFEPGSGHVGFVMDNMALGKVFSEY